MERLRNATLHSKKGTKSDTAIKTFTYILGPASVVELTLFPSTDGPGEVTNT